MADDEPMDVPAALWHRRGLIIVLTLVTLGVSLAVSFTRPAVYISTAKVWVKPTAINPPGSVPLSASIDMATEAELARSQPVAEIATGTIGGNENAATLLSHVSATFPPVGLILSISFSGATPQGAQTGADAFADAYLKYRSDQAAASTQAAVEQANQQIDRLQEQADLLSKQLASAEAGTPATLALANRLSQTNSQIAIWKSNASVYNVAAVDSGTVIVPPTLPAAPATPNHRSDAIRGLLLGLVIGVVAALATEAAQARRKRSAR